VARRLHGSLTGFLVDTFDIPRHAGFHRPYNPLPRRDFFPRAAARTVAAPIPSKGIGHPIPASPESSANMVNSRLMRSPGS
jgi:hypothetical protein